MRAGITLLLLGLTTMGLSGCGYSLGYRMPEGVRRLAVPLFRNETFPLRREIEYELTRALRQVLELETDVRLVSRSDAEAVLEGTVISVFDRVLTEGPLDQVEESSLTVTTLIQLLRTSDGEVILERTITDTAAFSVQGGETEEGARREAIDEIAERIVASLEAW